MSFDKICDSLENGLNKWEEFCESGSEVAKPIFRYSVVPTAVIATILFHPQAFSLNWLTLFFPLGMRFMPKRDVEGVSPKIPLGVPRVTVTPSSGSFIEYLLKAAVIFNDDDYFKIFLQDQYVNMDETPVTINFNLQMFCRHRRGSRSIDFGDNRSGIRMSYNTPLDVYPYQSCLKRRSLDLEARRSLYSHNFGMLSDAHLSIKGVRCRVEEDGAKYEKSEELTIVQKLEGRGEWKESESSIVPTTMKILYYRTS
ncbi:hypothetical protein PROFUN_14724 [Planoprotostelium fungivorum]|uniref:Uncharacterized protein n=1 Tax=Planoprotostelium fungivorum TaxID=1890364 RepID=A0A2P6N241_9EUKA|nr:hypothetical protein PROFUN_14724 [Planoprotostelium fungivorum]